MLYSSYLCISPSFELHFLLSSTPKLSCPNKFWWIFTRKVWHQLSFTFIIIICELIELASYIWTHVEPYKEWLIKFMKFFIFKLYKQLGENVFVFKWVIITDEHRWYNMYLSRGKSFHLDEISVIWLLFMVFTCRFWLLCIRNQ